MTLSELIAKLEEAEEGSRELDAEIFRLMGLTDLQERHCENWCRMDGRTDLTRDRYIQAWAPPYTTSLDAALTLVREDCDWVINSRGRYACVWESKESGGEGHWESRGKPLPVALCIAALKARS